METSGLTCMLRDNKKDDLKRMYAIFARIPACLDQMRDTVGCYVNACGVQIVESHNKTKDPLMFVKSILDLKAMYDQIIEVSFRCVAYHSRFFLLIKLTNSSFSQQ